MTTLAKRTTPVRHAVKPILISGCVLLISFLLYGCSSLQFAYNRLDWLLAEQIDNYVSFSDRQETLLDKHLDRQLRWHRRSQLPIYAKWLRHLEGQLEKGLQLTDLNIYETELRALYGASLKQLAPSAAELLTTLSDAQVTELLAALEERNQDYKTERVDPAPAKQRKKRIERLLEHSERWLGDTTPQQRQRIEQWAAQSMLSGSETLSYRQRWQNAFGELLQERQQADFERRLYALAVNAEDLQSAELRRMRQHNLQTFKQLLIDLYALANAEQKHYLAHRLQTLAHDFDELAAQ